MLGLSPVSLLMICGIITFACGRMNAIQPQRRSRRHPYDPRLWKHSRYRLPQLLVRE